MMRLLVHGNVTRSAAVAVVVVAVMAILGTALIVDAFGTAAASLFAGAVIAIVLLRWGEAAS